MWSSMHWDVWSSSVKAIMVILMAMLMLSPSVSSALHRCDSHLQSHSEQIGLQNSHTEDSSASHHESHDCACPTHRVDCCHYQAAPAIPKLNLVPIYFALAYSKALFALPVSPLLEGPFQPPRS